MRRVEKFASTSVRLKRKKHLYSPLKIVRFRNPLTLSATTRKLIVWMLETTILEQQPTVLSTQPALRSLISGILDATPIVLSVYTVRQNSCIKDFIVWRETDTVISRTGQETAAFKSLSDTIFNKASRIGGAT